MKPHLRGLPTPTDREYDMPPMWDGRRVEWSEWDDSRWFICPPPKADPCACGSTAPRVTSIGTVHPLPGEMVQGTRTKRLKSGREYGIPTEVPAQPLIALHAERCVTCGLDTVYETATESVWELDATDYRADGSWAE